MGGNQSKRPLPQLQGSPGLTPVFPMVPGLRAPHAPQIGTSPGVGGTLGSGLWRQGAPGQPQGVGGLGCFRLGAEGSATHLLITEQQQLLEWLQLGLPRSRRGSTQPSSAPVVALSSPRRGGGPEGPPSGHHTHSQTGKLRHKAHQPAGKKPQPLPQPVPCTWSQPGQAAAAAVAPSPAQQLEAGTSRECHLQPSKQRELPLRAVGNRGKVQGLAGPGAPRAAPREKTPAHTAARVRHLRPRAVLRLLWGCRREPITQGPFLCPQAPSSADRAPMGG